MDSSNNNLTDGNFPEISEDQKPILSLLTNELNNVSKPIPADRGWFLYRPRTRSAKKRLSIMEAIVISSDSEGSDVECTRNHHVMNIVPKTEIVSNDSALEVDPCVIVSEDHFLKQEPIETDGSDKVQKPSASPVKVLSPVNTNPVEGMQPDSHCSNENDLTDAASNQNNILSSNLHDNDSYIQSVKDNNMDVDSTELIVHDDVKQNIIETSLTKDIILDGSLPEEGTVSHVISTDSDVQANQHTPVEEFDQQETETRDCRIETHGLSISPVEVSSTSLLVEMENNFHLSCSRDNETCRNDTDNSNQAKENIFLSEDLSNESQESKSVKYISHDIGPIKAETHVFCDSKENMWTEQNTNSEFLQTLQHTVTKTESPDLLIYGIGQMRQKEMLCECSSCSKGEYAITPDNDKADAVAERANHLKQKCLEIDLEYESDSTVEWPYEPSADTPQNSANDATHSDDAPAERLEWSSDQEDLIAEGMLVDDDGSKCDDFFKKERSDDSNHIGDNLNPISKAYNQNDAGSSNELGQKGRFHGQSKSDDELVTSGRYGQQVTNEAISFMIVFSNSAAARISSTDTNERMLRENVSTAPVVQSGDSPLAEDDDKSTPSVSSKSQDDDKCMDETDTGNSESEQEHGQQAFEKNDKSLKRRWSTVNSINRAAAIPKKRERIDLSTDSDSDAEPIREKRRALRKPKKSSMTKRVGGFFRKVSESLREKRKKMQARLTRRRKSLRGKRLTTENDFVVTPYREDAVVERMKGFEIIPDSSRDIESGDDT